MRRVSASAMRQSAVCALRRAGCVGREGVQAVFDHVEVERAEVDDDELVQRLVGAMKFESSYSAADLRRRARAVRARMYWSRGWSSAEAERVFGGVEVVEVGEQKAEGIAQLAVVFADALHEIFAGGDVFAEVDARRPRGG